MAMNFWAPSPDFQIQETWVGVLEFIFLASSQAMLLAPEPHTLRVTVLGFVSLEKLKELLQIEKKIFGNFF